MTNICCGDRGNADISRLVSRNNCEVRCVYHFVHCCVCTCTGILWQVLSHVTGARLCVHFEEVSAESVRIQNSSRRRRLSN